jgi:hypothetical protein
MTETHPAVDLVAGDDWEFDVTLLQENDAPYDLSGAPSIQWVLLDRRFQPVINGTEIAISITDALAGQCRILVPAAATTDLAAGSYRDVVRITAGGITSTLLHGPIFVMADPFGASGPAGIVALTEGADAISVTGYIA